MYIQQLICTLREALNVSLFRDAWRRLVDRHAVLRTSFLLENRDEPVQAVDPYVDCEWEESDWREVGIGQREERLAAYLRDDRRRGIALERPPLWRLHLFHMEENDYRLVWTSHHALFDGRSRVILLHELFDLYEALLSSKALSLARAHSFEDHVRQQNGRDFTAASAYWRNLLLGFSGATSLPERKTRLMPDDEVEHRTVELQVTEALSRTLESLAEEFDVTLNTIVHGAWALLLSFYSGTDDVVFGATRACRGSPLAPAASTVGLLINTLPVRTRIRGSASLKDWLRDLRSQWVTMREHEQTPLAIVRGCSELPASESLFHSIVVFERLPLEERLRMQGGNWENRSVRLLGITNYPLVLAAFGGSRLRIELTYDRRRFDDDAILGIKARLQIVLEEIASDPGRTLAELPMISPQEKRQLVFDWNATAANIPHDGSVAQIFEAQARRTPDAVALVSDTGQWTYAELNARANRLAHRLRAMGVGFETPVAICAERSPEMVAGILGVLKAGAAYVPLDPTYPAERLRFILRDTQAPVVLTQYGLAAGVPAEGARVVLLDADASDHDPGASENPTCPATFDSLAYIMYTSGSTGTPKGVAVPHRGILRLVFGVDYVALDSRRKILHLASPAFDASTFELWGSLLHGGRCVLFPGRVPALDVLERVLRDHQVDTLFLTTALFHAIVDESAWILSGVEQLLVGGEVLSVDHVRRAHRVPARNINDSCLWADGNDDVRGKLSYTTRGCRRLELASNRNADRQYVDLPAR